MENTEGMTNQEGVQFLERVMKISDLIILGCNTSFSELEQEKNLPNGAIVRQALRLSKPKQTFFFQITFKRLKLFRYLAFTNAVKNCLEARRNGLSNREPQSSTSTQLAELINETKFLSVKDPVETLVELQLNSTKSPSSSATGGSIASKTYPDCLLQYVDILRLKALIYRDVVRNDRNKLKPFVVVVLLYIFSFILFQFFYVF